MIKAGIIGATGYAGGELVRILANHLITYHYLQVTSWTQKCKNRMVRFQKLRRGEICVDLPEYV